MRLLFDNDQYELIEFSDGKKLERFGGVDVLRDCAAAEDRGKRQRRAAELFASGHQFLRFERDRRRWAGVECLPERWQVNHNSVTFGLKPAPFGHVGIFPEQAENWDWIVGLPFELTGLKAMNLFAYTGGTTLAMAACGAHVTHIDASRPVVNWAKRNASLSGLADASVRWIVDDAAKFVKREIRRGNRYDIIVADPPAFGHADGKMSWKIDRDFGALLLDLAELCPPRPAAVLISCHTIGFDDRDLKRLAERSLDIDHLGLAQSGQLELKTGSGRRLNCGHFFRWHNH